MTAALPARRASKKHGDLKAEWKSYPILIPLLRFVGFENKGTNISQKAGRCYGANLVTSSPYPHPTLRSETSFGGAIFGTYPLISFQAGVHGVYPKWSCGMGKRCEIFTIFEPLDLGWFHDISYFCTTSMLWGMNIHLPTILAWYTGDILEIYWRCSSFLEASHLSPQAQWRLPCQSSSRRKNLLVRSYNTDHFLGEFVPFTSVYPLVN